MIEFDEDDRDALQCAMDVLDCAMGDTDGVGPDICPVHGPADFRGFRAILMLLGGKNESVECDCEIEETEVTGRLFDAIRRYTFDAPDNPTDQAIGDMVTAIGRIGKIRRADEQIDTAVSALADCAARWCTHVTEDSVELLEAAEALFPNEDFKGEPSSPPTRGAAG